MKMSCINVVAMLLTLGGIAGISSAATLIVGDKTGWIVPTTPSFYSDWASKQSIKPGDSLVFTFPPGAHTVTEVSKAAYDSCNTANPLSTTKTVAPASYTLSSPGTHYFICTIPGHCAAGQKISVAVSGKATATAPSSSKKAPTPTASASAPAATPTSPAGSPTAGASPTAGVSPSATPPGGNFAAPTSATGVLTLSFLSLASVAFFF